MGINNVGTAIGAIVEITDTVLAAPAATISVSGMDADYYGIEVYGEFATDNAAQQGITLTLNATASAGGFGTYDTAIAVGSYAGNKVGEAAVAAAGKVKTGLRLSIVNSQTADYFTNVFFNSKDATFWWSGADWYDLAAGVSAMAFACGGGANFRANTRIKILGVKS